MRNTVLMKSLLLVVTLFFVADKSFSSDGISFDAKGGTYSLLDLYEISLKASERIKLAEEDLTLSKLDREKALSVLLPAFAAFGDYARYSEKKTYEDMIIQPESSAAYGIKAGQSFTLNGKELIALKIANQNIEKRTLDLDGVKEEYLFNIASAYFNVLQGQKRAEIAEANVKRLSTQRDAVSARLRLEDVPKTAMFRADAELSKANADRVLAENGLTLARSILCRVAGIPEGYVLKEPVVDLYPVESVQLHELKKEGLSARSELKSLDIQKAIAQNSIQFTKSDYWPKISIEGQYLRYRSVPGAGRAFPRRVYP